MHRCFFQELIFHPQLADLIFHLSHAGTLQGTQRLLRLRVISLPLIHPVTQRALIDLQLTGHLGNRTPSFDHELHRLSLELR